MINVTYAITVCNEMKELIRLLNFLQPKLKEDDEILIQYDETNVTTEVLNYLKIVEKLHPNHKVIGYPLNGNFAEFKNSLKSNSNGIFIFQIDADEIPSEYLIDNIHQILEFNKEVDLFFVPRINTVSGLTQSHIDKWKWSVNSNGWLNFPDYQSRIYRRTSEIEWSGKVHETVVGYNTVSVLPAEEDYCLYHPKDIERQERQNSLYENM
jgi:hypothetical protein